MAEVNLSELADRIIDGHRIRRGDDLSFFITCNLEELEAGAGKIQKHFRKDHIDLCTIINARSGRCPENCKYCAQSAHNKTGCEEYPFLPKERIVAEATRNAQMGVNRFAIVTAGRALSGKEFDAAIEAYEEMHGKLKLGLCASMGFVTREQLHRLHMAGVTTYHHNIETSRRNFPNICTTHTYEDKMREIRMVKEEGLNICSGGIIGMGEAWEDRLDMAISLSELEVYSIPLNALMPIPGSPLANLPQISSDDLMRTVAFFRYINPEANIRLAAGRKIMADFGAKAFRSGASASITGDMLTTSGTTIRGDFEILERLGLSNAEADGSKNSKVKN